MSHFETPSWSGLIAGHPLIEQETAAQFPYVVIEPSDVLQYSASLAMGNQGGVPGTVSLRAPWRGQIWIPGSQMSYAGIEIGSPVEDDVIINVVRPQRGEPFYLPDELLEAVDDLATAHNIDWRYRKTSRDLIVAAKAAVYPEDRTLEIEGENGLETLVVPAQHLIAGGLRAAMAFELERMKLL